MLTSKLFIRRFSGFFNLVMILFVLFGSFGLPTSTHALGVAIRVNTAADNTTKDGLCSLREAITNANRNFQYYSDCTTGFSDDGIFFSDALGAATITLNSSLPAITDRVGLSISGGNDITISGNGVYQVFVVNNRAPLALDGLTITRGGGGLPGSAGGGLHSSGGLVTITNSTFSENRASNGGGLSSVGGYVTIRNSTFSKNSAGLNVPGNNNGGGIYSYGSNLTITDSTFSQNGAYRYGGGIYIVSGVTTITRSSFSGNGDAFIYGAGIYANSGELTITMSTFSGNTANRAGGVFVSSGTAVIANSTFSENIGGGVQNLGIMSIKNSTFSGNTSNAAGGIINMGTLSLFNTILANSITGRDCFNNPGSTVTGNNNLVESDSLAPNACGTAALAVDPRLEALTGSPAYFVLNSNSLAINAGDDAICAAAPVNNTSQNGVIRPQGVHCDIGSFEMPFTLAQSPQEMIIGLSNEVQSLVDKGAITVENGKVLTSILDSSIQVLDQGDTASGITVLTSLIDQVNTWIKSKELESELGQLLIDNTQAIIESLY